MRILHCADIHIGVENYSKIDPDTGLSSRLIDFLDSFDELVLYAMENDVDLVLFAGDAYKSRDPSQTHQREFARRVARLANAGIPVFLLIGNHDSPHVIGRATSLEIFDTLEVANVYIGDTLKTYQVETRSGPLQIIGVPWIRRSAFLARDETRGLNPEQVNEAIQERLARVIRTEADNLDTTVPAVLAGHVTVSDARTSSEQLMMLGRDHVLLKSDVGLPQLDYVALGHIHKHQILGNNPLIVYSGSVQRVDFGEERDPKGFCIVDLDPEKPVGLRQDNFEFVEVAARPFVTVSVKIEDGDTDPTATTIQAISMNNIEGAIVRVQVTLPGVVEGHFNEAEVRQALEPAQFVASISLDIAERPRTRLGQDYSKSLDPKEALQSYLQSRELTPERSALLMERAQALMDDHARNE